MIKRSINKRVKLIGLTGGICCGKTTVAEMFERLGARVIEADKIARELIKPYKPAWRKIVRHFGEGILLPDKNIDRKKIADEVFRKKKKLHAINKIIHPEILSEIKREVKNINKKNPGALIILDAALILELG